MNIYKVSQEINNGYDTYDSMIVISDSEESARKIAPGIYSDEDYDNWVKGEYETYSWINYDGIDEIEVTLIGVASAGSEEKIVLSSFNAG